MIAAKQCFAGPAMIGAAVLTFLAADRQFARAQVPDSPPQIVTIEGPFGRADVDVRAPSVVRLYLAGPREITAQSVLAAQGPPAAPRSQPRPWATGAYTYVVEPDGRRHESRYAEPAAVESSQEAGQPLLTLRGVKLAPGANDPPVAIEDWIFSAPGDGSQLVWKIVRHWQDELTSLLSGSPGLFFSFDARRTANSVTSTVWYDPLWIKAESSPLYRLVARPRVVSENHLQTIRDRDTWAIFKLWTNWHAPVDLRLEALGGHLYRRGSVAFLSEAGVVTNAGSAQHHPGGQVEEITLKISAVDKAATGYQLAVTLPDKQTESSLKDFYGSVLNGGAVNDQKGFDFGNQTDGWYYAGSCWMYGMALAAGTPAPGRLSARPYDAASAFREHLAHVFSTLDEQGRARFGYNQGGQWVDDNLHTIIGTRAYLLHSGDLGFVRQNLPALERMLAYFVERRNERGLFALAAAGAHWYYDAIRTSGVNGYYNAFFYKAANDLAEMQAALGRREKAAEYRGIAEQIKEAFNEVLWKEDAPGGPRYLDWIDDQGQEVAYFCDLCQWPPIAVGIASPEQARKIVATADARIAQLEAEFGYQGFAGLSALWPVPENLNPIGWQTFGRYMNGGSLLCQTYWEVVARARAGDHVGAARRLRLFARRAAEISWAGDNPATMQGEMAWGDGEPYLADMVAVTASLIHGVLGIEPTWDRLEVTPRLPPDWPRAAAEILYKGRRHRVSIDGQNVETEALEQVIVPKPLWVMDFNLRTAPGTVALTTHLEFPGVYEGSIRLKRIYDDGGALGLWKLDEPSGAVQDASPHQHQGTIVGQGVRQGEVGHTPDGKSYHFDGNGSVSIADHGSLAMDGDQSFTVQCWFKTEATDSRVMLGKAGAYCVYVKDGKLAAWRMQDGGQFREALGSRHVADGQWHHVAAVFDRQAQKLSLYLDGRLDTSDGSPAAHNPVDISALGASTARDSVTLGGLGGKFAFVGWLDEISLFRGALAPAEFSFGQDYPSPYGTAAVTYPASGTYQSPPCHWGEPVQPSEITVAAQLDGGQVTATVETSQDGFHSVLSETRIPLRHGVQVYPLDGLREAAAAVRVRFDLTPGPDAATTPLVDGFRITGAVAP